MERLLELTDIEIRMGFAASCIEAAAKQVGCTYKEMYRRMKRVGLIDKYILRHYNTIHTESRENITANILESLDKRLSTSFTKAIPASVSMIPIPDFICTATFIS